MNTRYHWLNTIIDSVSLVFALAADLILNIICMIILAPGPLEAVGFAAIAIIVVLFSIRSWIIGNKILWAMFAIVSFFFDLSLFLISTDVQTESKAIVITVETDSELSYLTKKSNDTQEALRDLRTQYNSAMKRDTLQEIDSQIKETARVADETEKARKTRLAQIESGELNAQATQRRVVITAEMIFGAIGRAIEKGRYWPLAIFAMIFAGLQLVMITAANSMRGKTTRKKRHVIIPIADRTTIEKLVETWVRLSWMGKRKGRSTRVLDQQTFMTFITNQGQSFSSRNYWNISKAAILARTTDASGEIIINDEQEAIKKILEILLTNSVNRAIIKTETRQPELF
jgi:hypothetical protein